MTKYELQKQGGVWLGAARKWIQWNCINGSTVIWGSKDRLQKDFTVSDIEDLAADIAISIIEEIEFKKNPVTLNNKQGMPREVDNLDDIYRE